MSNDNLEKDIEKRFLDNILNQEENFENSAISVYQKLVFIRYFEVISNSFPLFTKEIDEKVLDDSIKAFMKSAPSTAFIWKIPNDYINFVKKNKIFHDKKYLYELLYYDWVEIELYMKEYKFKKQKKFSFKDHYIFSKSARIHRFKYDIVNGNYDTKRENFLVIYNDFNTNQVVYREINQLIFVLFQNLNKKQSIGNVLKNLCIENEIDFKEAKSLLKEPLEELLYNKVINNLL